MFHKSDVMLLPLQLPPVHVREWATWGRAAPIGKWTKVICSYRRSHYPQPQLQQNVTSPEFSSPAFESRQHTRSLSDSDKHPHPRHDDPMLMSEESEVARAGNSTTSGNMFSSNNSCFMGGSYYNVQGDAHFSPFFQVSFGAPYSRIPTIFIILS